MSNAGTNLRDADVSALIGVTQRLSDLMTAEITALRAMRPKDMRPLQDEKAKLTSRYDADLRLFSEHSDDMIKVDPALVEELKQSTATLRTILVHNKLALAAARSVNEALVHTIEPARLPAYEGTRVPANVFVLGVALGSTGLGEVLDPGTVAGVVETRWRRGVARNQFAFQQGLAFDG